jgi:predicted alpha/beta hydrolase family esterase
MIGNGGRKSKSLCARFPPALSAHAVACLLLAFAALGWPLVLNAVAHALTWEARASEAAAAPRADRIRIFLGESAALACCLGAWPFAPLLARAAGHEPASARGAVLLVAGCSADRASFWLLARRLRRLGWSVAYARVRPWPRRREAALSELDESVCRVAQRAPAQPISLVAHAAGGLAARDYLRRHPQAPVRTLLTLGTAHRAASQPLLRLPCLHGPGDAVVREINAGGTTPHKVDAIAIASDFDAWVAPPSVADDPGAFNIAVAGVGHFGLLVSRKVFQLIVENLAAVEPGTPPSLPPRDGEPEKPSPPLRTACEAGETLRRGSPSST